MLTFTVLHGADEAAVVSRYLLYRLHCSGAYSTATVADCHSSVESLLLLVYVSSKIVRSLVSLAAVEVCTLLLELWWEKAKGSRPP